MFILDINDLSADEEDILVKLFVKVHTAEQEVKHELDLQPHGGFSDLKKSVAESFTSTQ